MSNVTAADAPTTPSERSVRIGTIISNRPEGIQAIVEAGVEALRNRDGLGGEVNQVISQIIETYEPEVPAFDYGDEVRLKDESTGKVMDRWISEDGMSWEYEVKGDHYRPGTTAYREAELAHYEEKV